MTNRSASFIGLILLSAVIGLLLVNISQYRIPPIRQNLAPVAPQFTGMSVAANLPAVPFPEENRPSAAKQVLGKILFWDEQLSFNDTIACGSCHRPGSGGADPRSAIHPGNDAGTIDDVHGSPGIIKLNPAGQAIEDEIFGLNQQVTSRSSSSNFGALWASQVFWDGRAGPALIDPLSGKRAITTHGALESQVIATLSNPAEMTNSAHSWNLLTDKLAAREPLQLASELPPDIRQAIEKYKSYPGLFDAAFGDANITPLRIAFAIADYQRTLIADQTPWDYFQAGKLAALTEPQQRGWQAFQDFHCTECHTPPLFTNNDFFNIGLRLSKFDTGRMRVTGRDNDAGRMKVPSLRNVGLRHRFMHTGQFSNLSAALRFYISGPALKDRDELPSGKAYSFNMSTLNETDIVEFLRAGLTDPRVQNERFPFDRPQLQSEQPR